MTGSILLSSRGLAFATAFVSLFLLAACSEEPASTAEQPSTGDGLSHVEGLELVAERPHASAQLPPPGPDESVLAFVPRRGTWEPTLVERLDPGSEFIHADRLFRVRGEPRLLQWIHDVDVARLPSADASWDPERDFVFPTAADVVYVTGADARHVLLSQVRDAERFAFQGRVFVLEANGELASIRPTGVTLNRAADAFSLDADELVDLDVLYEDGTEATISGTPEHPFFVPEFGDYVEMGELALGSVLVTDTGSTAMVVAHGRRVGDFDVFNFEVEHAHNYFVAAAAVGDGHGLLVHNRCFAGMTAAPNWRSGPNWGHTFSRHGQGSRNRGRLTGRANSGYPEQGQWLDNNAAAEHIFQQVVDQNISTPTIIELPPGLGQFITGDGRTTPARFAIVDPSRSGGVRSAYPISEARARQGP